MDLCRGFHTQKSEYTFFSSAHKTFSSIIPSILSDHNDRKLETDCKEDVEELKSGDWTTCCLIIARLS